MVSSTHKPSVTLEINTVAKSNGVFVIGNKLRVMHIGIIFGSIPIEPKRRPNIDTNRIQINDNVISTVINCDSNT